MVINMNMEGTQRLNGCIYMNIQGTQRLNGYKYEYIKKNLDIEIWYLIQTTTARPMSCLKWEQE